MARLHASGPDIRLPNFKGRASVYWDGNQWVMRGPQLQRRKKLHPDTKERNDKFREATRAMKVMAPSQQIAALRFVQNSQYLPRDFLMMALYGRGLTIWLDNGERWTSVASRNDMSVVLDALTTQQGSMLYRGPDWWLPIPAGQPGQVLIWDPATNVPVWITPAPSGGGELSGFSQVAIPFTAETSSYATKASYWRAREACTIIGAQVPLNNNGSTRQYTASLWTVTGTPPSLALDAMVAQHTGSISAGTESTITRFVYDDPLEVSEDQWFASLITITDGGDTEPLRLWATDANTSAYQPDAPVDPWPQGFRLASNDPQPGDPLVINSFRAYLIPPIATV